MWQRFTERARRVVFLAQEEAGRLGESFVTTEHLLLGLVKENDGAAARILERMGVSPDQIRLEVERGVTRGDGRLGQDMQLTPRAKRIIDLAYDEARQLNNNYIGTEHLLLGLVREGDGLAARVLGKLGVTLERARAEVLDLQTSQESTGPTPQTDRPVEELSSVEKLRRKLDMAFPAEADLWRRFAEQSLRVVITASEVARALGQRVVDTEHLLIGLLRESDSVANGIIERLGADPDQIESQAMNEITVGDFSDTKNMQLSDHAACSLLLAAKRARDVRGGPAGSEHLLLGMLVEGRGQAARILAKFDLDEEKVSQSILSMQGDTASTGGTSERRSGPWQRFTERARRVVFFAQEEAGRLGTHLVCPEHLLLGLVKENDSVVARILERMGVKLSRIKPEVEKQITTGEGSGDRDMQITPRAKRVIDLAYDEATMLGSNCVGTEHLLLGLLREGEGIPAAVLAGLGVDLARTRHEIVKLQGGEVAPNTGGLRHGPAGAFDVDDLVTKVAAALRAGGIDTQQGRYVLNNTMRGRDLLSISDLSAEEIQAIFDLAINMKSQPREEQLAHPVLPGKTLAMIFEKPSLRTRVTFEAGMTQLGGHGIYLQPADIKLGQRESVADAARNLERWVDGIMARVFAHKTVTDLAQYSKVPVINGLSDLEHPCQALADFLTIFEHKGTLKGLKLAFIGDGNNVCHSLMLLAAKVGTNMSIGCPAGYEPDAEVTATARTYAEETGATITITTDPFEAVKDADAIYTDVWASMGQEAEQAERAKAFASYQVNKELVDAAKHDVIVLHCLPAHRGEEITDEVMDGPHSVVFDEAENRLHAQKAVMALLM